MTSSARHRLLAKYISSEAPDLIVGDRRLDENEMRSLLELKASPFMVTPLGIRMLCNDLCCSDALCYSVVRTDVIKDYECSANVQDLMNAVITR